MQIFQKNSRRKRHYLALISNKKTYFYKIAYGYLRNEADALEAVDESVFLGLLHLNSLKKEEYMKTWFVRILINECKRILRERSRLVVVELLPEAVSPSEEKNLSLFLSVAALPDELKEVILLRYYGDLSVKDTAEVLAIPQGTVATRTKKALMLLKEDLMKEEGGLVYEVH